MIKYEDSYFEGEIINGFFVESKVKRAWAAQMEVLEEIKRICNANSIKFFADWGTLLGAVRHKGFVPWDDDMDICMLRDDYEKFLKIASSQLGKWFELLSIYNDNTHDEIISRVITGRTIHFEKEYLESFHYCPYIVGVDIFPVDYIPRDKSASEFQLEILRILFAAVNNVNDTVPYDDETIELVKNIEKITGVSINYNNKPVYEIKKLIDRISSIYRADEADEVCSMTHLVRGINYRAKKEWFEDSIEMKFENTTIPVPKGYDGLLRIKYSDNYMTPVFGGGSHDYPFFKKQEVELGNMIMKDQGVKLSYEDVCAIIDRKVFG